MWMDLGIAVVVVNSIHIKQNIEIEGSNIFWTQIVYGISLKNTHFSMRYLSEIA